MAVTLSDLSDANTLLERATSAAVRIRDAQSAGGFEFASGNADTKLPVTPASINLLQGRQDAIVQQLINLVRSWTV